MSEQTEVALRGDRYLFGVKLRLMGGEVWTVPPMPARGAEHAWFRDKVSRANQQRMDFAELVGERVGANTVYREAIASPLPEVDDLDGEELDAAFTLYREKLAVWESEESQAEREELKGKHELALAELEKRNNELDLEYIAVVTEIGLRALKRNYPELSDDTYDRLVTVGHLDAIIEIVSGQRQIEDLFPRTDSDPVTA